MAAGKNPLSPEVLFEHVQDAPYFHLPRFLAPEGADGHVYLPQPFATPKPAAHGDAAQADPGHDDGAHDGHADEDATHDAKAEDSESHSDSDEHTDEAEHDEAEHDDAEHADGDASSHAEDDAHDSDAHDSDAHAADAATHPQSDDAGHGDSGHGEAGHGGHHAEYEPVVELTTGISVIDRSLLPMDFVLTKFMVIELLVAIISILVFSWLASKTKRGAAAKGRLANLLEAFLVFIRDEIARPTIGKKEADEYLPFLWTLFFFVLGCNLFGMIPWMGSPTGSLAVTGVMALMTFITVVGVGVAKYGFAGFLEAQVPHMDLPGPLKLILVPMIFAIELLGLLVKHGVLAIRLLANMVAGHIVLAVIIGFISYTFASGALLWGGVSTISVLGATAFSLLELFVAFLQAYIFVFLSSLFIGSVVHPH